MSVFSWFTTCIDVGPEGFTTPKRPDRGNEGDLGMVAEYESGHKKPSSLLRDKVGGDGHKVRLHCKRLLCKYGAARTVRLHMRLLLACLFTTTVA